MILKLFSTQNYLFEFKKSKHSTIFLKPTFIILKIFFMGNFSPRLWRFSFLLLNNYANI